LLGSSFYIDYLTSVGSPDSPALAFEAAEFFDFLISLSFLSFFFGLRSADSWLSLLSFLAFLPFFVGSGWVISTRSSLSKVPATSVSFDFLDFFPFGVLTGVTPGVVSSSPALLFDLDPPFDFLLLFEAFVAALIAFSSSDF
tara:strand:- start:36 stop:461 length:426 start_codon:yes stop_codon:yes gene_type:complete